MKTQAIKVAFFFALLPLQAFDGLVVASNNWTAAYAASAGAVNIRILAGSAMSHPPEYELKPADIQILRQASVVVYAGYEAFAGKLPDLIDGLGGAVRLVKISTGLDFASMSVALAQLAAAYGKPGSEKKALSEIQSCLEDWRADLKKKKIMGASAAVNKNQLPLAQELGFKIVYIFGPGLLEGPQIVRLAKLKPSLIIDNIHNGSALPLRETVSAPMVSWRNFPQSNHPQGLIALLNENRLSLNKALPDT